MRPREPALLDRLKEIVDFVNKETGGMVPVVANGDCWGVKDRDRICEMTGESYSWHVYHSVSFPSLSGSVNFTSWSYHSLAHIG